MVVSDKEACALLMQLSKLRESASSGLLRTAIPAGRRWTLSPQPSFYELGRSRTIPRSNAGSDCALCMLVRMKSGSPADAVQTATEGSLAGK